MPQPDHLPKNTRDGQFIALVEKLGFVPFCVRDAFSWLPHPVGHEPRRRSGPWIWFWEQHGDPAPTPEAPDSPRCNDCIFQEPPWSQGYAGCSHSWLHDKDQRCRAFFSRAEFLKQRPDYAQVCRPIQPDVPAADWARLSQVPYWSTGERFIDFAPSANFPSHFYATLNWEELDEIDFYSSIEVERLRRFDEWKRSKTIETLGTFQLPLESFTGA